MRLLPLLILTILCTSVRAQKITVPNGYSNGIGIVVSMLKDWEAAIQSLREIIPNPIQHPRQIGIIGFGEATPGLDAKGLYAR